MDGIDSTTWERHQGESAGGPGHGQRRRFLWDHLFRWAPSATDATPPRRTATQMHRGQLFLVFQKPRHEASARPNDNTSGIYHVLLSACLSRTPLKSRCGLTMPPAYSPPSETFATVGSSGGEDLAANGSPRSARFMGSERTGRRQSQGQRSTI